MSKDYLGHFGGHQWLKGFLWMKLPAIYASKAFYRRNPISIGLLWMGEPYKGYLSMKDHSKAIFSINWKKTTPKASASPSMDRRPLKGILWKEITFQRPAVDGREVQRPFMDGKPFQCPTFCKRSLEKRVYLVPN